MSRFPRWFIGLSAVVLVLLALASAGVVLAYGITRHQWDASFVRQVASIAHLPAARVGTITVPYADYLALMDAQHVLLTTDQAKQQGLEAVPEVERRRGALEALLRNAASESLAQQQGIEVTPLDVDRFYDQLIQTSASSTTSTPSDIGEYLRTNFGWTPKEYKKFVVRSGMLREILMQKYQQVGKTTSLEQQLDQRLAQPDVKRYLHL